MVARTRQLLILLGIAFIIGFLTPRPGRATTGLATLYTGLAEINGPYRVEMRVDPPVSMPGQQIMLTVEIVNQLKATGTPELRLLLPAGVHLGQGGLPTGATVNMQTNGLNWLPVVPANGGHVSFELPLRVETADVPHPEQEITAVLRYDQVELTTSIPIWIGIPPQIEQITIPVQVAVGQPVQLDAQIGGSGPFARRWRLGDGREVDVDRPEIVYGSVGFYEIELEVSNPLTTVSRRQQIAVVPHPAAQFTLEDVTPGIGQPVQFISRSGGQPPLVYQWDFGDGVLSGEANPIHTFEAAGTFLVHLTLENAYGQSEAFLPVTVGLPPEVQMSLPPGGRAGEPVVLMATGDETVVAYRWDFGDGRFLEGQQVSHVYNRAGDFYVIVQAENEFGRSEIGQWLHIDPGILRLYLPLLVNGVGTAVTTIAPGREDDSFAASLPPVELTEPFSLKPIDVPPDSSPAEQLFLYINEARRQFNLPPLNHVFELSRAAQQHTDDMAAFAYTAHLGADGSYPAERLLRYRYPYGYAGEATAWGFQYPWQAVEFWINSPAHRRILLNQYATDVGVGFTQDFSAPNVWYWTAEFGNRLGSPLSPVIRLQEPAADTEAYFTDVIVYRWNWPLELADGQVFVVYLQGNGPEVAVGRVAVPELETRYGLQTAVHEFLSHAGTYTWQVRLEDALGNTLAESERRTILLGPDPAIPTPTPEVTPTAVPTIVPTQTPTPTPQPTIVPTQPPVPPPPVLITATPVPSP
ncbi:MAG: PKD domain-containing protein [Chloroflexi bacterium]|nr:MAG: PKD domain-containing protein [Chloroflexota bacterium]